MTRVPCHSVTDEQLAEWGFTVEMRGSIVGSSTILRKGMPRQAAIMAAWAAGFVSIESPPPFVAPPPPTVCPEMAAFYESIRAT